MLFVATFWLMDDCWVKGDWLDGWLDGLEFIRNYVNFIKFSMTIVKSTVRKCLDDVAFQSILASEKIFLARDNKEWLDSSNLHSLFHYFFCIIHSLAMPTLVLSGIFTRGRMWPRTIHAFNYVHVQFFHNWWFSLYRL